MGKVGSRSQDIKKKRNFQNYISNFSLLSNIALNCFVNDIEFKNSAYAWIWRVLREKKYVKKNSFIMINTMGNAK